MKNKRQTSVIRRMYAGFAVMVLLFVVTVTLMLQGTNRIHAQLEAVTSESLPLVATASQASVRLLAADKIFKDYLTSQNLDRMATYQANFTKAHDTYLVTQKALLNEVEKHAALRTQTDQLLTLEQRYFAEANKAMANYRAQLIAQTERQRMARRFQQLYPQLSVKMKEYIDDQDSFTVKMMAKSYFIKLKQTETITSDALAVDDIEAISKAMKQNRRQISHLNDAYRGLSAQLPTLKQNFDDAIQQYTRDIGQSGGILATHYDYVDAKKRLYDNISVLATEIDEAVNLLNTFQNQANNLMDGAINKAETAYNQGLRNAVLIGLCATAFAIFIGWILAQSVRKPLRSTLKTLEALTDGDMTQRIEDNHFIEFQKLSSHINTLAGNLQEILGKIGTASEDLTNVATENQTTTTAAKDRLNEQRQQTGSVATAMTEMEQSVADVSRSAQSSMERVIEVSKAADTGREVMSRNINTAHQLSSRLDESVSAVGKLQEMSSNIGSILDVIRNIADQTNLLALNAAIEAARAGDQGRGFAVVADEVRVLAKRTTDSTAEIESMIQSLQSSSGQAVNMMQSCVTEMDNSISQASDANGAMEEIQAIILDISEMSEHIAHAAQEQRSTTGSIARSLEDISHIADANFTSMEEVAEASSKLDQLAHQQNSLVHRFKV
ncbi:chemotaxis protein [Photobacterium swingsii]|uniref:Methyl-accepting chemotaxis protein n=1 Tax=Photobacterium swingsii TaxID=680026 RepID=A0A0J8VFC1_9GAMM|nr:methyl-accepting chemotaxis protein [Photobacterium swingsii]KMV32138.1 chemotaxis protein [Photobacterium swingsii]PSW26923.1 methyl-accepting chemotaxis protein [Photobacterium swingsii]